MTPEYLYAVRDLTTGKLVSKITNPARKFWQQKDKAQMAINRYRLKYRSAPIAMEVVTFKLIEVTDDE